MKRRKPGAILLASLMTVLVSMAGGFVHAAPKAPLTPELAAKREMVRKQQEQRITPQKRKAAAEALKAERVKIYQAKQARPKSAPAANDGK